MPISNVLVLPNVFASTTPAVLQDDDYEEEEVLTDKKRQTIKNSTLQTTPSFRPKTRRQSASYSATANSMLRNVAVAQPAPTHGVGRQAVVANLGSRGRRRRSCRRILLLGSQPAASCGFCGELQCGFQRTRVGQLGPGCRVT